jgi:heteromeric Ino2p/Ino4p transcription factor
MSSHANSRSSPSGGNGSASNSDRPRLTDAEKKQNHILSEQKRRQAIRMGFDRLAAMTPGMNGLGRSEATVLSHAVDEIKKQTAIKERIKRKLLKDHPDVDEAWFENFYKEGLVETTAAAAAAQIQPPAIPLGSPAPSNTSSTGSGSSSSKGKSKRVKREN